MKIISFITAIFLINYSAFALPAFQPKAKAQVTTAPAQPGKDAELTPDANDTKCTADHQCIVTDKGCCRGEKPIAINKFKVTTLKHKAKNACSALEKSVRETDKIRLCSGREKPFYTQKLRAICKDGQCALK